MKLGNKINLHVLSFPFVAMSLLSFSNVSAQETTTANTSKSSTISGSPIPAAVAESNTGTDAINRGSLNGYGQMLKPKIKPPKIILPMHRYKNAR